MDKFTLIGILAGLVLLAWAVLTGGPVSAFVDGRALAIILGGLLITALIARPLPQLLHLLGALKRALTQPEEDLQALVQRLAGLAMVRRRDGLLALEDAAEEAGDSFFYKGMMLAVDGNDDRLIRELLELEIDGLEQRHRQGSAVLDQLARLAPAFGLVGTLVGLIRMLGHMDKPGAVGPGMAVALVATLYGVLLANLVFAPLSTRLKARSAAEVRRRELIMEGILALQSGEGPAMIIERLEGFMSARERRGRRRGEDDDAA